MIKSALGIYKIKNQKSKIKNLKRILIAPNGFKESMSSTEAAQAISNGIKDVMAESLKLDILPLADGGAGTVESLISISGGHFLRARVKGPLGKSVMARYGFLPDKKSAIIEMAASSGLALLSSRERNPMLASSYGTGELIKHALEHGAKRIILGIGDSATVDGGIGALQALGVNILDIRGRSIGEGGGRLARAYKIDLSNVNPLIFEAEILIASDVENPLLGENGAAAIFGPQKGATPSMVKKLEAGLKQWAELLSSSTGLDLSFYPGSGAAGGFATGFIALFGAKITSGSLLIFDYGNLKEKIRDADLIFTAEGKIDNQTLQGKTPSRLAAEAKKQNRPLIAFAAQIDVSEEELRENGFYAAIPIIDRIITIQKAYALGPSLLRSAVARTVQLLLLGAELRLR